MDIRRGFGALLALLLVTAGGARSVAADDVPGDQDGLLALVAQLTDLMTSGTALDAVDLSTPPTAAAPATQRSVLDQLADAIEDARGLLAAPHLELLGGMELGRLIDSEDGSLLQGMLAAAEAMEEDICRPPRLEPGEDKPTACVGHNLTLSIQGGYCDLLHHPQHGVICHPPRVVLVKTRAACTHKHTTPLRVVGKECKVEKAWGEAKAGYLVPPVRKSASLDLGGALEALTQRAGDTASSTGSALIGENGLIGEAGLIGEGGRLRDRITRALDALAALAQRLRRG